MNAILWTDGGARGNPGPAAYAYVLETGDGTVLDARGEAFDLKVTELDTPWEAESADEMWAEMSEGFGPIKTLLGALPPERAEAFKTDLVDFFRREETDAGMTMSRPYLLVLGVRKGERALRARRPAPR